MNRVNNISALLLTAGIGSRLMPLTLHWPKCLMPIGSYPLLEYWLSMLYKNGINDAFLNLHHHSDIVELFLKRRRFKKWVKSYKEDSLLGTAGTLRALSENFRFSTILLIHADNWSIFNLKKFINYHFYNRPPKSLITMMTFKTENPINAGIIEKDDQDIVISFHEKVKNPPGNLANGAVYLIEPEVTNYICKNKHLNDFSTEIIPKFIGKIATWENKKIHRDIGTIENLKLSQKDIKPTLFWKFKDKWINEFQNNFIHKSIESS